MVATKDHHIDPGDHWSKEPDFVDSWPVHCKVGTDGEAFHPNLDPQPFDAVFLKGEHEAAYSGFEGRNADGTVLADWLRGEGRDAGRRVRHRHGLLRARHRARRGRRTASRCALLTDLIAGVAPESTEKALAEMSDAGAVLARPRRERSDRKSPVSGR